MADWAFLANHAQLLLCVAREPDTLLRHIAECIGITERATHRIICHLIETATSPGIGSAGAATTRSTSICLSATPSKPTIEWATSSNRCCAGPSGQVVGARVFPARRPAGEMPRNRSISRGWSAAGDAPNHERRASDRVTLITSQVEHPMTGIRRL